MSVFRKFYRTVSVSKERQLNIFSKLQSKCETHHHSKLVYKVKCGDCHATYIGQTKKYLTKKISTHQSRLRNNKMNASALRIHATEKNNCFDFNNVEFFIR